MLGIGSLPKSGLLTRLPQLNSGFQRRLKVITYDEVRRIFDYREDGVLIWNDPKSRSVKNGDIAGSFKKDGYCQINYKGKLYRRCRLIWLWHNGYIPENYIDHINRNRSDDRIENLREVTQRCNLRNKENKSDNSSGVKGVYYQKSSGKWMARITIDSKDFYIGKSIDFDEIVLMRLAAEQCLDWSNCDSSSPAYKYAVKNKLIHKKYSIKNFSENAESNICIKNKSGINGVTFSNCHKKWQSYISFKNKKVHLGFYRELDNAVLARLTAELCRDWHGHILSSSAYQYAIEHNLIKKEVPIADF